jgi:hypothetical protein
MDTERGSKRASNSKSIIHIYSFIWFRAFVEKSERASNIMLILVQFNISSSWKRNKRTLEYRNREI